MGIIVIRSEVPEDYRKVEELTREAFWNHHHPGCDEHYLVHVLREHEDFIPELDFVAEQDGEIVGNVMYTKANLVDEKGEEKEILTFGPISVHPNFQRNGGGVISNCYASQGVKTRKSGRKKMVLP